MTRPPIKRAAHELPNKGQTSSVVIYSEEPLPEQYVPGRSNPGQCCHTPSSVRLALQRTTSHFKE